MYKFFNPDAGVLTAMVNVLRNAFVAAFSRSLDQNLHVQDLSPQNGTTYQ